MGTGFPELLKTSSIRVEEKPLKGTHRGVTASAKQRGSGQVQLKELGSRGEVSTDATLTSMGLGPCGRGQMGPGLAQTLVFLAVYQRSEGAHCAFREQDSPRGCYQVPCKNGLASLPTNLPPWAQGGWVASAPPLAILPIKKGGGMRPNGETEPNLNVSLWALNMEKLSTEIQMETRTPPTGTSRPSGQQN